MRERMRASVMNPITLPFTIDATIQMAAVIRGSAMKPTRGFAASTPAKRDVLLFRSWVEEIVGYFEKKILRESSGFLRQ